MKKKNQKSMSDMRAVLLRSAKSRKSCLIKLPFGYRVERKSLYLVFLVPICMSVLFALMVFFSIGKDLRDVRAQEELESALEAEKVARRSAENLAALYEYRELKRQPDVGSIVHSN